MSMFLCGLAFGSGGKIIRQQFAAYFAQGGPNSAAERYLASIDEDGTWADIDYASQRRGNWPTRNHLDRLADMASAYADPASVFHRDEGMKQAVLRGLDHWIQNDYRNPNWYNARIGVPYRLGSALVLMGDAVPAEMLQAAQPIFGRSELGMTGQNKVWCAGIGIMKGLLYADSELLGRAVGEVWSELQVSTGEGIQPDWSFHQHGPQQQFGNYGLSFGDDMVQWAYVLRGTEYALAGEKLEVLRRYLLEGPSWILWNGRMDLSGCGRQVDRGCQQRKARSILRQLEGMKKIDPRFRDDYQLRLDSFSGRNGGAAGRNSIVGFKPFWRSELAVQRRPDWYASVKMSSTRVVGSESCNSENVLGLHLGDGVLLTYIDGREYENIMPLWDWKRLPGTTCDQGLETLLPKTLEGYGGSDFSGVIGCGETGAAAMIYKRGGLTARKSWFLFQDGIVCLGAGISGETAGSVFTSVEQSRLAGPVSRADGGVLHGGIRYEFSEGEPVVKTGTVTGDWGSCFPARGSVPAEGGVFSLWLDHGKSPDGARYAYRICPSGDSADVQFKAEIVANSESVQAVRCGDVLYAVFYEAGKLDAGPAGEIEVDGACLLYTDGRRIVAADPAHALELLAVRVNGRVYQVELPRGAERGKQVEVQ